MIRKAAPADLDDLCRCAERAYRKYVERIGKKPAPMVADFAAAIADGTAFVSTDDSDRLTGFVVFYPQGEHMHLENVAVDPERQGQGIGAELIEYAERQARSAGFGRVELYTNARMTENLELYPRLGYSRFDRRVEDGFDRVYFEKRLADT